MDKVFARFLKKFGGPVDRQEVPASSIERYRGKLPNQLLEYWAEHGWCGYGDGIFWIVNPQEHEGVVASWLEGTILEERDTYHLIAPATRARKDLQDKLQGRFNEEFLQTLPPKDAKVESLKKAKETMSNRAGLHNPDLSAGGKDIIADFGDRQVNSSIGPQWKNKIENLKSAAENISKPMRESTFLNVRLH